MIGCSLLGAWVGVLGMSTKASTTRNHGIVLLLGAWVLELSELPHVIGLSALHGRSVSMAGVLR
jgi:hypothetical protein